MEEKENFNCHQCHAKLFQIYQYWQGHPFCSIECIDKWDKSGEWKWFIGEKVPKAVE